MNALNLHPVHSLQESFHFELCDRLDGFQHYFLSTKNTLRASLEYQSKQHRNKQQEKNRRYPVLASRSNIIPKKTPKKHPKNQNTRCVHAQKVRQLLYRLTGGIGTRAFGGAFSFSRIGMLGSQTRGGMFAASPIGNSRHKRSELDERERCGSHASDRNKALKPFVTYGTAHWLVRSLA